MERGSKASEGTGQSQPLIHGLSQQVQGHLLPGSSDPNMMSFRNAPGMIEFKFHPEAALEFEEAFCWYAERSEGAAIAFDKAVSMAFRSIEQGPERYPLLNAHHRIILLAKNYPDHIIYRVSGNVVTVIAVAHHRRKPKYWQDRS